MHRSGTSALAGALHHLGVALGGPLMPPHAENERGFWELREVVDAHDDLLASFGATYRDPEPLPDQLAASPAAAALRERLLPVLSRNFAHEPLWGVKDPRLSLLLPLWDGLFAALGAEPRFVLTHRSPWEVAGSLGMRQAIGARRALSLWERYVSGAEEATAGKRRVFTSYDRLLADGPAELARIAEALGVDLPVAAHRGAILEFLTPGLRHHAPVPLPDATPAMREAADAAMAALDALAAEGETPARLAAWREAAARLRAAAPPPGPRSVLVIPTLDGRGVAEEIARAGDAIPRILFGRSLPDELRTLADAAPAGAADPRFCDPTAPPPALVPEPLRDFRLAWLAADVPSRAAAGRPLDVRLVVRNDGSDTWRDAAALPGTAGRGAVRLGWRWRDAAGKVVGDDAGRRELPFGVPPGGSVVLAVRIPGPPGPGAYTLQLDLVQELVAWFETRGAPRLEAPVLVE